jgi:hypothetical protein
MKKTVILIVSAILIAINAGASLTGVLDLGYKSVYVSSPGGTLYNDSVFQQDIILEAPLGLYGIFWSSYSPEKGINSDFGDEIDFILGIYQERFKLGFNFSYIYLNAWDINSTEVDFNLFVLNVDLPKLFWISPYINLEYDASFDEDILPGGFIYRVGCAYEDSLLIQKFNLKYGFNFSMIGHDGVFGLDSQALSSARVKLNITYNLGNMEIIPEITYQKTFKDVQDGGLSEDKLWWGINLAVPFIMIE